MVDVDPVAEIELPFAPNRMAWGADEDQLLVAATGSTNPIVEISISEQRAEGFWGSDDLEEVALLTAFEVDPSRLACAVAESLTDPLSLEPYHRLRAIDMQGSQFWLRAYVAADDLIWFTSTDTGLMVRNGGQFTAYDLQMETPAPWTMSAPSGTPWTIGPSGSWSRLAVASPPMIVDIDTLDVKHPQVSWPGRSDQVVWGKSGVVTVLSSGARKAHVTAFDSAQSRGSAMFDLPEGDSVERHSIAASPDGEALAYVSGQELVLLTLPDLSPHPEFRPLQLDADDSRRTVRFSADGTKLAVNATPSGPGVTVVDAASGVDLWRYEGNVDQMEFSPSGGLLTLTEGERLRCYEVAAITAGVWAHRDHWELPGRPRSLALVPVILTEHKEGTWLGVVGTRADGKGFEYFRRLGSDEPYEPDSPTPAIGLTISPGREVYAVWHSGERNPVVCRALNHDMKERWDGGRAVRTAAFVTDELLVDVRGDTKVRFWDPEESDPIKELPLERALTHLAVAPSGSVIAVAGDNFVWLLGPDGSPVTESPITVGGNVTAVAFDAEPLWLVVAHDGTGGANPGQSAEVVLVDPQTGVTGETIALSAPADLAVISPEEHLLATASGNTVRIDSLAYPGEAVHSWTVDQPVTGLVFHPQVRCLAVASREPNLSLFDLDDGPEFWWGRLPAIAHDLAFDRRGEVLAVACDAGVHFYGESAGE